MVINNKVSCCGLKQVIFHFHILAFLGRLKMFAPKKHDLSSPSLAVSREIGVLRWNDAVEQTNCSNTILYFKSSIAGFQSWQQDRKTTCLKWLIIGTKKKSNFLVDNQQLCAPIFQNKIYLSQFLHDWWPLGLKSSSCHYSDSRATRKDVRGKRQKEGNGERKEKTSWRGK